MHLARLTFELVLIGLFVIGIMTWVSPERLPALVRVLPYVLLLVVGIVAVGARFGRRRRARDRYAIHAWALPALIVLLTMPAAYAVSDVVQPSGGTTAIAILSVAGILIAMRLYMGNGGFEPWLVRRVMVVGTGAEAAEVEKSLAWASPHVRIIGFYPVGLDKTVVSPDRILSDAPGLTALARSRRVDEIIVAVRDRRDQSLPLDQLLDCRLAGTRVLGLSCYFERTMGQVRLDSLRASWLIFGEGFRQGLVRTIVKRCFDIIAAGLLLALLWPLMLVCAVLIVIDDGLPILYRQQRTGKAGRPFTLYKFRSMRRDAEGDGNPRWASSNDARVTRLGAVLRRFRLDELPQLYNVLRGDMSLVGPRPERPHFVSELSHRIPFYTARHSVKPGLTGWAQVRYRYGESMNDAARKLEYDLYYVKNHTLFLDLIILLRTVTVVLTGKGAQ
ncbi:MAG: TIGR03013 family XrtA/PEP-CTERM system glycosyltransferase [Thioalkalivibrio sp.]